jgi:hypothetical protein
LHAHPGGSWQVFDRLMQLLPQALPVLQTLQHVAADCGSSVPVVVSAPRPLHAHGGMNVPRQIPRLVVLAAISWLT